MKRFQRLERLYNRLNGMHVRSAKREMWDLCRRIDRAMSYVNSVAWLEGCRAEWVGE